MGALVAAACSTAPPPARARLGGAAPPPQAPARDAARAEGAPGTLSAASAPAFVPAEAVGSKDSVVVRVAGTEFTFADAFDEFLFNYRGETHEILRKLAGDRIVEIYANEYGVTVDPAEVEEMRTAALRNLAERVVTEFGRDSTLAWFCDQQLRTSLADYEAQLTRSLRRSVLASYVIRFDAVKCDRVVVRHIVVHDRDAAVAVLGKVRAGADFAATARQESVAPTRVEGGRIPPFDREFDHPITAQAFELPIGGIAGPIEDTRGKEPLFHVIKVVERLPGSQATFAEVRDRLRDELRERPIERFEFEAFMRKAERRFPVEVLGRRARTGETPPRAPLRADAGAPSPVEKSP